MRGVDIVFGLPGEENLDFLEALRTSFQIIDIVAAMKPAGSIAPHPRPPAKCQAFSFMRGCPPVFTLSRVTL